MNYPPTEPGESAPIYLCNSFKGQKFTWKAECTLHPMKNGGHKQVGTYKVLPKQETADA